MNNVNWKHLVLAFGVALSGCGADGQGDVVDQQAALSQESSDAVGELDATVDVAEGDLRFAEVLPAAGAKDVREDDRAGGGLRDRLRHFWPGARDARFDFGRLIRLAGRGVRQCSGADVEKTMADSGCTLVGQDGKYIGHLEISFNDCTLPSGVHIDGKITVDNTKALAAGATCEASALKLDVTHAVKVEGVKITGPGGARFEVSGTGSAKYQRGMAFRGDREWTIDQSRKRFARDGRPVLDQHLMGHGKTVVDATGSEPALVHDGAFTAEMHLIHVTATTASAGVRRVASCCHPIAGTWDLMITRGTNDPATAQSKSRHVAWGPTCGDVTIDGEASSLPACL